MKKNLWIFVSILLFSVSSVDAREIQVLYGKLPPYMYQENGEPAGFYYDLLMLMKKEMKDIQLNFQYLPVKRMIYETRVRPGRMCLGITRNESRESLYKWVGPTIQRRVGAYRLKSRAHLSLNTREDFQKYQFGVGLGFAAIQDLLKLGVPMKNIQEVPVDSANIFKLLRQRIDFYASIDLVAVHNVKLAGGKWDDFHEEYILNDRYHLYYAFHKDIDDALIRDFQQALDKVKQSGEWQILVNRYTGKSSP